MDNAPNYPDTVKHNHHNKHGATITANTTQQSQKHSKTITATISQQLQETRHNNHNKH